MLVVLGLLTATVSAATAYLVRSRRRAAVWNDRHACGWCAAPLPLEHAFIDGFAVCPGCVSAARWRLGTSAGMALGASGVLGLALLAPALEWWARGIPVGAGYVALAVGATLAPSVLAAAVLRRMQARNQRALAASPTTLRRAAETPRLEPRSPRPE